MFLPPRFEKLYKTGVVGLAVLGIAGGLVGLWLLVGYGPRNATRIPASAAVSEPVAVGGAERSLAAPRDLGALSSVDLKASASQHLAGGNLLLAESELQVLLARHPHDLETRLLSLRHALAMGEPGILVREVNEWFLTFGLSPWTESSQELLVRASDKLRSNPAQWLEAFGVRRNGEPGELILVRLQCLAATDQASAVAAVLAREDRELTLDQRNSWNGWVQWQLGSRSEAIAHWRQVYRRHLQRADAEKLRQLGQQIPAEAWPVLIESFDAEERALIAGTRTAGKD